MISRREFLTVAAAAAAIAGPGGRFKALAQGQNISQDALLKFNAKGQVTLLHFCDCHAQIKPVYFREPSVNLGVGDVHGLPPHITGADFLKTFDIDAKSLQAYALSSEDFVAMARNYGKVGGMDRMATLVKAIRAARPEHTLLLDSGDTLHGSYTALESKGADMIKIIDQLGVDAITGHWEFTLGADRVVEAFGTKDDAGESKAAFLAGNIFDTEWDEPVFKATKFYEKNGVNIAVIGQAFPFTPIANPRYMIPKWSFGIRESQVREHVQAARDGGADVVVLLSHNGFDVDRKMAGRVEGIDVILTGHTHDALPRPVKVGNTLLIASGSNTKFLSRLDLQVSGGKVTDYEYALIPVLSDAITPDPEMAALIEEIRKPHEKMLNTPLAKTESLLYRRGNFNGTFDDLICQAMLEERDAEIALSPGFRWGPSLLPGQDITWDDVYSETAMTYPACYRINMTGENLRLILEDVGDNLFNKDPYYQQGGDMVRIGGMGFTFNIHNDMGKRVSDMTHLKSGKPIDPKREYVVAGWASVNEATQGPPIWDVVANHLKTHKTINIKPNDAVKVVM